MVKNLTCQCRERGNLVQSPHAARRLSPCSATTESMRPRAHALQQEKLLHWEASTSVLSPLTRARESPSTMKTQCSNKDPVQPKKKKFFLILILIKQAVQQVKHPLGVVFRYPLTELVSSAALLSFRDKWPLLEAILGDLLAILCPELPSLSDEVPALHTPSPASWCYGLHVCILPKIHMLKP